MDYRKSTIFFYSRKLLLVKIIFIFDKFKFCNLQLMNSSEFYSLVKSQFPFEPTLKQDIVLKQISEFVFSMSPDLLYVLKGYAGTRKTTIIGALVSNLWKAKN